MKRIILLELCLLFLATTFQGDRLTGWIQQTIPRQDLPVKDLQFVDSLTGFMVQSRYSPDTSFISKTTDGGNNWTVTQFVNYYLTSLHFIDKNIGYCVGGIINTNDNGVVLKTTDGGNNWFTVSLVSSFINLDDVMFTNKDTGWVCSADLISGGLWCTINGGNSWQLQLNDSYDPSKIFFINSNTGWVIGNSNVNLYKTTNCGVNWYLQSHYTSSLSDVFFINIDTGWVIGGSGNGILRTTNQGSNWYPCNNLPPYQGSKLFFINNKRGWVGSSINEIFATNDGFNWGTQYSPRYTSFNVSFVDSLKGWAGYSGLVHTIDGGGTIVEVNSISSEIPKDFALEQNYPNPFNNSSKFKIKISKLSNAKVVVYDIQGREVQTIVNEKLNSGIYEFNFNGNNITSGIYFYRMIIDNQVIATKRMTLIK